MAEGRAPRLMLVTDRLRSRLPLAELVREAVAGGVDAIQVREQDLPPAELVPLVRAIQEAAGSRAIVLVNGDLGVARALGVGIHLPERGPSIAEARAALGDDALVGRSVHSPGEAMASDGANFLVAGHVFASASKTGRQPLGPEGLRPIVQAASAPVVAIGGIDAGNVRHVLGTGARGVAVISAISAAGDPRRAAAAIRSALERDMGNGMGDQVQTVEVVVNGKADRVAPETTVSGFLATKNLRERLVVVELNGAILPREAYASTRLAEGDRLEVVHFVGGG